MAKTFLGKRGTGKAIHLCTGNRSTLCNHGGLTSVARRTGTIKTVDAQEVTCKKCIQNMQSYLKDCLLRGDTIKMQILGVRFIASYSNNVFAHQIGNNAKVEVVAWHEFCEKFLTPDTLIHWE